MSKVVTLDSGPLGEVVNPKQHPNVTRWLQFIKESKISLRIMEIIDYELRRELTLAILHKNDKSSKAINNLNKYRQTKRFIPLDPCITLNDACDIWAHLRLNNEATADLKNIDVDVILAAQALSLKTEFSEVIIVTTNISDMSRFGYLGLKVWDWKQAIKDGKYKEINLYVR